MVLVPHLTPNSFYFSLYETRSMYNMPCLSHHYFIFQCINATIPRMTSLTTLEEHLKLFWRLRNCEKVPDARLVVSNGFRERVATKILEKIKSAGFVSGALVCREDNAKCHRLNEARTWILSLAWPSGQLGPEERGPVAGLCRNCRGVVRWCLRCTRARVMVTNRGL